MMSFRASRGILIVPNESLSDGNLKILRFAQDDGENDVPYLALAMIAAGAGWFTQSLTCAYTVAFSCS